MKIAISKLNSAATIIESVCETTIDSSKFVTATLGDKKKEISLAVKTGRGLVLITGCAHPGLDKMMEGTCVAAGMEVRIGGNDE